MRTSKAVVVGARRGVQTPNSQQRTKTDDRLHAGKIVSDHFLDSIQRVKDDELGVVVIANWPRIEPVRRGVLARLRGLDG